MSKNTRAWHVDLYERVKRRKKLTKTYYHVGPIQSLSTQKEAIEFAMKTNTSNTGTLLVVRKARDRAPRELVLINLDE